MRVRTVAVTPWAAAAGAGAEVSVHFVSGLHAPQKEPRTSSSPPVGLRESHSDYCSLT